MNYPKLDRLGITLLAFLFLTISLQPSMAQEPVQTVDESISTTQQASSVNEPSSDPEEAPTAPPSPVEQSATPEPVQARSIYPEEPLQSDALELQIADLEQQASMADSAVAMVRFAKFGLALSFFTLLGLGYSLHLNRKTAKAALKSAKAAEDVIKQDRAQLICCKSGINPPRHPVVTQNQMEGDIEFHWAILNYGKSPALDVSVYEEISFIRLEDIQQTIQSDMNFNHNVPKEVFGTILPDDKGSQAVIKYSFENSLRQMEAGNAILARVKVIYRDKYGKSFFSENAATISLKPEFAGGHRSNYQYDKNTNIKGAVKLGDYIPVEIAKEKE
ncbi:MAG: hypothetical protein R3332_00345 [Pseudohongiellaceae bacterium]|nr:hypothetical protein [Pseudohongiellaceae bacterium]